MPKDCKICGASKYTEPKNGFVTCVYCHTKYSLAEIDEAPNDELNTINLVERYSKSVCEIHTVSMIDGNSIGSSGTGWYIGNKMILTNSHVALLDYYVYNSKPCDQITCVFPYINKDKEFKVKVDRIDQPNDIAILLLDDDSLLKDYPIKLCADNTLKLGQTVFTIGNSIGRGIVPQKGMISKLEDLDTYYDYKDNAIKHTPSVRTTLLIRHGNSGGPLLNSKGEAVGIMKGAHCRPNTNNVTVLSRSSNPLADDLDIIINEEFSELSLASNLSCIKNLLASQEKYTGKEVKETVNPESILCSLLLQIQHSVLPSLVDNHDDIYETITKYKENFVIDLIVELAKANKLDLDIKKLKIEVKKFDVAGVVSFTVIVFPQFDEIGSCYYSILVDNPRLYFTVEYPGVLCAYINNNRTFICDTDPSNLQTVVNQIFSFLASDGE